MKMWFCEIKNHTSVWEPCLIAGDKPLEKMENGTCRKFRCEPVAVPIGLQGFSLFTIARILSPDGDLFGIDAELLADFLNHPTVNTLHVQMAEVA